MGEAGCETLSAPLRPTAALRAAAPASVFLDTGVSETPWAPVSAEAVRGANSGEIKLEDIEQCKCGWPPEDPEGDLCAPHPALCGMCENIVSAMYWNGDDPVAGCYQYQSYTNSVCANIAKEADGQAEQIVGKMEFWANSFGPQFGSSRYVCAELHCCEPTINQDCEVGDWGEWEEDLSKCPEGKKVRKRQVVKPKQGSGADCPPLEEEEPAECEKGACTLDVPNCELKCPGLTVEYAVYCPSVHVKRSSDGKDYFKSCDMSKQDAKDSANQGVLKDVADMVPAIKKIGMKLIVAGHASCDGCDVLNQGLSGTRAEYAYKLLVNEMGADASVLEWKGYGERCPKGADVAANRRTEFYLSGGECTPPDVANPAGADGTSGSGNPPRCTGAKGFLDNPKCTDYACDCVDTTYC